MVRVIITMRTTHFSYNTKSKMIEQAACWSFHICSSPTSGLQAHFTLALG
ncbi:hypothetical protein HMPREF0658_1159 [Hoylesella marshii DSM 16973 = JCM 13450]|uniref:Uncharacterized protein n=1 Tax=Hoylesella marshii DSM 16973 = JCM 13450 TaxID=862515 RepID=E0NSK8_9BACT|nr:hypothetical protein HMPREF0658_1159 [Hoylesella marshii DSM 16973 = JCM 13450]